MRGTMFGWAMHAETYVTFKVFFFISYICDSTVTFSPFNKAEILYKPRQIQTIRMLFQSKALLVVFLARNRNLRFTSINRLYSEKNKANCNSIRWPFSRHYSILCHVLRET